MKTFFITGNQGKFREIADQIENLEMLEIKNLSEIQSLDIKEIIEHKLMDAVKNISEECKVIVEDTGLYLSALNNFPGPLINFLSKAIGNEGIFNLCYKLKDFGAYTTTVFGLLDTSNHYCPVIS